MAFHELSKERINGIIEVNVSRYGNTDSIFRCDLKFDTSIKFKDGFKPDSGWYWGDLWANELKYLYNKGIKITYSNTQKETEKLIVNKLEFK